MSEVYVKAFQPNLTTMATADVDIIADLLLCSLQTSPHGVPLLQYTFSIILHLGALITLLTTTDHY